MILDSSALLAIYFDEPEREDFLHRIERAALVGVGSPTLAETAIVLAARLGEEGVKGLRRLTEQGAFVVVSFEEQHWRVAVDAWLRYGRGRHPAALNFGDCLAYATAKVAGRALLCKGADFAKTDLDLA